MKQIFWVSMLTILLALVPMLESAYCHGKPGAYYVNS